MDESWRMRMGMPSNFPRRRSAEHASSRSVFAEAETLDLEDFADVFGGPPRSVFWRKMSCDFTTSPSSFYEEIFRPMDFLNSAGAGGRGLPSFRIPGTNESFYSDIFGPDDERRSRERSRVNSKAVSKSKSNSSSVLSSEEMSPLRPAIGDHVVFSDFAPKLRPINVPSRRNTSTTIFHAEETFSSRKQNLPTFQPNNRPTSSHVENQFMESENSLNIGRSYFGFSSRRVSSPETISVEQDSYPSFKISVEDVELNSPSSVVSSLCQDPAAEAKSGVHNYVAGQEEDLDDDDEDDEIMSSYVIEISSDHREGTCDAGIDEAIAWAKEKFQKCSSEKDLSRKQEDNEESAKDGGKTSANVYSDEQKKENKHEIVQSPKREMEQQDENIRLWSAGKETDIRLLLSTLHYILWPNSGWSPILLTNLIESSKVKKAYQKARLCLHPDKLQQRGATIPQKYVAHKAFSILQDAWASFISLDISFAY
ncbi:hypothetical protein UlMin_045059 [Ulmus minor]